MIFKSRLTKLILAGKKTQTRRPRRGEEECRYHAGRSYAVQPGRGKESVGRILITEVREEMLHELSQADAIREGFRTTEEFFDYWREIYREGPIGLEVPVWVISFELDRSHKPRLLHRQSQKGYTANRHDALEDEPEGVDALTLDRYAEENAERFKVGRRQETERLTVEQRLAAVREEAVRSGVDLSRQEASLVTRLEAMERKVRRRAA